MFESNFLRIGELLFFAGLSNLYDLCWDGDIALDDKCWHDINLDYFHCWLMLVAVNITFHVGTFRLFLVLIGSEF